MSSKFSRSTKMQTAPAVCHPVTPGLPVWPSPYPEELYCYFNFTQNDLHFSDMSFLMHVAFKEAPENWSYYNRINYAGRFFAVEAGIWFTSFPTKFDAYVYVLQTQPHTRFEYWWRNQEPRLIKPIRTEWLHKTWYRGLPPWPKCKMIFYDAKLKWFAGCPAPWW